MNLNKAVLIGRLTRDPETRTTPSGAMVANFSIATSRIWKDENGDRQEKTDFHNIVAWRRLAEIIEQYTQKGSLIMVEGRIETRSYEDQNGVTKYRTEIIADSIQLGPRQQGSSYSPSNEDSGKEKPKTSTEKKQDKEEDIPTIDVNIDDVPF